jgi:hypothetical protein
MPFRSPLRRRDREFEGVLIGNKSIGASSITCRPKIAARLDPMRVESRARGNLCQKLAVRFTFAFVVPENTLCNDN